MHNLTRWIQIGLTGLLVAEAAMASEMTGSDPLWQSAVAVAERNGDWVPGRIVMLFEMKDSDGEVKGTGETWIRLFPGDDGEVRHEMVKVLEDGRDITEKARSEAAEQEEEGEESSFTYSSEEGLFDADVQSAVKASPSGEVREIGGRRSIGYRFTQRKASGETVTGTAWLDAESGIPLEITSVTDPLPKRVKRMESVMEYHSGDDGLWYPEKMTVTGEAGFLFFRREFRTVMTFDEYWRQGSAAAQELEIR